MLDIFNIKVTGIKPPSHEDVTYLKVDESYLDETLSKNELADQDESKLIKYINL